MRLRAYIWHWAWWCPAHSRSCWPPPPCRSAPPCGGPWWGWGRWRSSWCRPQSPSARDHVDQRAGAEPWTYILHRVVSLVIEQPDQGGPGVTPSHHTLEGHPPALHQTLGGGGNLHEIGQNFNTERQLSLNLLQVRQVWSEQARRGDILPLTSMVSSLTAGDVRLLLEATQDSLEVWSDTETPGSLNTFTVLSPLLDTPQSDRLQIQITDTTRDVHAS